MDPVGKAGREQRAYVPRGPSPSGRPPSIPPLSDQPAALVLRHAVFLDSLLDRARLIRSFVNQADEFGRRPAEVVDGPGVGLLLDRSLRHCEGYYTPHGGGGARLQGLNRSQDLAAG